MGDRKDDRLAIERECKITSEMIEAGLPLLYKYDPEWGAGGEETVAKIFFGDVLRFSSTLRCNTAIIASVSN